eukprot:Nitzschia sp. Nitz4//scaffold147_size54853//22601//24581//NITZ4_006617-RA/size54853-augustus-gene-0.4-mRNA-1//-1//CDS//3329536693//7907//frame0
MPAVSVLPLGTSTVGSIRPCADSPSMDPMASAPESKDLEPTTPVLEQNTTMTSATQSSTSTSNSAQPDGIPSEPKDTKNASGSSPSAATASMSPSQAAEFNHPPSGVPSHPQQAFYIAYQSQFSQEPPSPIPQGGTIYDANSIGFPFAPQYVGVPAPAAGSTANGKAPSSPSQSSLPPPSPLFPRVTQQPGLVDPNRMLDGVLAAQQRIPLSPGPPYMATLGPGGAMYPSMGAYGTLGQASSGTQEDVAAWGDRSNPQLSPYPHNSPLISSQGMPLPYVPGMPPPRNGRSYSFEENTLPPAAASDPSQPPPAPAQDGSPTTYSSYAQGNASQGTLFAHQQPWGYGPPPDMYGASASPLQPRPTMAYPQMHAMPRHMGSGGHAPPMGAYGNPYFQASSPGPPIQTTASNKGPEGANLFIFHIPNHFTNVDMYNLFCPYGNLLSVRIMVEKDTGRSRGFGFVSYDNPEAAALAIKELNGCAIGNKRLKVQHKQIRPNDQHGDRGASNAGGNNMYDNRQGGTPPPYGSRGAGSLPPAGPGNNVWVQPPEGGVGAGGTLVEGENVGSEQPLGTDPMSNMDPLREALPDVPTGGTETAVPTSS